MRKAFSEALVEAARLDERVLLLTGDHGYALFDDFQRECRSQYLNAGVAEQNMVGVAAGLAKDGFRPVVYGLSAFIPIRVLEQIKLDFCYEGLPVIFIGDGAGLVYSALGASHQSTEDISALRALPNMSILSPGDPLEMTACMQLGLKSDGPVYLRMGKADLGSFHTAVPEFRWGDILQVREGNSNIAFIATGSLVQTAIKVAESWPSSAVWSAPSIQPLNSNQILRLCKEHETIVVLEEHSVIGGLGSAVAEIASSLCPRWVCRIGVQGKFSKYCGTYEYLLSEHHLDLDSVREQVKSFVARVQSH